MTVEMGARVAVVLKGWPRLSETFIAQEIAGLEARGVTLEIWSLRRPTDKARHPVHDRVAGRVVYLPEYLKDDPRRVFEGWRKARRLPGYALARRKFLADLRRDPTANRIRRWGQALVLAAELPASIDRLYWDTPYHLVPSGKTGVEAFAVIREAMKLKNTVALGRLVMGTRERICAIEIEEAGLVLTTLRTAEEVRDIDEVAHPDLPKADRQMLAIAEKIIDQQSGDFDPAEFTDRYEEALRDLIEEKKKGKPVKPSKPANDEGGKVVDLMEALRKSLQGVGAPRARAERFTAAKKKPPAKRGRAA